MLQLKMKHIRNRVGFINSEIVKSRVAAVMINLFNDSACVKAPTTTAKESIAFERVTWEQSKNSKKYWTDKQQDIMDKDGVSGFNSR